MDTVNLETCEWSGAVSPHQMAILELPQSFPDEMEGNYILCRRGRGLLEPDWVPIYIGEGNLQARVNDPVHLACAVNKGATHVHCAIESRDVRRGLIETDLLAGHPEAYHPTGCNKKLGG